MSLQLLHQVLHGSSYSHPYANLYDQNFAVGIWNNESVIPTSTLVIAPLRSGYMRPWRNSAAEESGVSSIQTDKNEFMVNLDVQQFKREELRVRVENEFIVVYGKHEERGDEHGYISRQFTRKYKIPEDVDDSTLVCTLSTDGVLVLRANKKDPELKDKKISISLSNKPAVKEEPVVKDEHVVKNEHVVEDEPVVKVKPVVMEELTD